MEVSGGVKTKVTDAVKNLTMLTRDCTDDLVSIDI